MKYFIPIILVNIFFLWSCNPLGQEQQEPQSYLENYNHQYLTLDDVQALQPSHLSAVDSASWVEQYKKQWLRNQIIIEKAEKDLPKNEKNVQLEVLDYKANLLKYRYENYYIRNKINMQVSDSEIKAYYDKNKDNLLTTKTLVKATYIEISNTVKDRYKIKSWLRSKRDKDQEKLRIYCFQNAKVFDDFDEEWVELSKLRLVSKSEKLQADRVYKHKVFEQRNDTLTHYIFIEDITKKGQIMPLNYAQKEIVRIIINKRKQRLIEELNQKINQQVEDK